MIDLDLGGACPRQRLTCALIEALGLPIRPGPGTDALIVGAMDYPSEQAFEMVSRASIEARQDTLLSVFADTATSSCVGLALIYRTKEGARVMEVEPCSLQRGQPIILVTKDRRRAFAIDERCILSERPAPPRGKVERGVQRAWGSIHGAMRTIDVDPEQWEACCFSLSGDARSFADSMA